MAKLFLREAKESDRDLLYEWVNDPAVRKSSFSMHDIPYKDHCIWFENVLKDDYCLQYIVMDKDIPVGQVRVNIQDEIGELDYSIAAKFRRCGYGKITISLILKEIVTNHPNVKVIRARVKPDNISSQKVLIENGLVETYMAFEIEASHIIV